MVHWTNVPLGRLSLMLLHKLSAGLQCLTVCSSLHLFLEHESQVLVVLQFVV
jgi:hypothetical protein